MEVIFKDLDVAFDDALILHHVSGLAKPGEMLAVMGPSGAGKSTLLNAISGRLPIASGSILLNGNPMTHRLRRKICYVLQEDAFFPNLTLKQTLTYTALLRLPEKMPSKLKFQRVIDVIEQLDLKNCSDTAMGGMFMQGLSGGEKKRASIACELITNPALIMLDEPTSGLDSAIAYSLMKMMKQYTEKANKTVIATIHQPSSQIFHMFDNILLLAKGKVAYFGKCSKIIEFFSSLSLYCTPNWNPADFILEKVKESEEITNRIIKAADNRRYTSDWPPELRDSNASINNDISEVKAQAALDQTPSNEDHPENVHIPEKDQDLATTQLIMKPSLSNGNANDVIVLCQNLPKMEETDEGYIMDNSYYNEGAKWQSTFLTQYVTLTQRSFFQAKTRILSKLNIIQTLVLGLVCGLLWFQTPKAEESLKDRNGMMFFVISYFGFFTMFDIITSFPEERTVITKERAAGIYRLSAYYLSKMTSEAPLVFLLPVIMTTMAYWMCGLTPAAGNYISFLLLVLLHSFVAQSFGIVVGVACLDLRTSITTGATFMLVTLLAGGFYQTHYPVWMEWAKYFSFLQYSYHAAMKIEYLYGTSIQCGTPGESVFDLCNQNKTAFITGDYYLTHSGITRPIYIDILVLVTLVFTFRILGYIILRYVRRPGGCKHK